MHCGRDSCMVKALALSVVLSKGQAAINVARRTHLIENSLEISAEDGEVHVPITRQPDESELKQMSLVLGPIRIGQREFTERPSSHPTLIDVLRDSLPPHLLAVVPKSLDVIGHIAIVEVPAELVPFENSVGKAVLETCPNVRTVMAKASVFSQDYRIRELRLIAGEDNTVTYHREHGCVFQLDVRTVFFSPRLGHERLRIASQVQPNETVVDMFAGVGPYSILVAKRQPASTVYAVDINPSAFKFLVSNVLANKVLRNVSPIMGDIRYLVRFRLFGIADRVIMNLPGKAINFVQEACSSLKEKGGILHFYSFESGENSQEVASRDLKERVEASGRKLRSVLATRVVKEIAPYKFQVAVDARLE